MTTNTPATPDPNAPADTDAATGPETPTIESLTAALEAANAEAAKWKGLSRKHEGNATALQTRVREFESAGLDDLQRAEQRAQEAERRAAELEARSLRAEVAAAKGVPVALLTASTEDDLNAQADALLAFKGPAAPVIDPQQQQPTGQQQPRFVDPAQLGTPSSDEQSAKEAFARQLFQV